MIHAFFMPVVILLSVSLLAGCATRPAPEFSYDDEVPPLPATRSTISDDQPRALRTAPAWTPS